MTTPPSENLLRRLSRVSPTVAFLVALALLMAGLFAPGIIGGTLLLLLGACLAGLTFTTWPVQKTGTRAIRVILLVLLFAAAVAKIL